MAKPSSFNVIDLFAGAGGLSVGAHLAGARVRSSVELNPVACNTLRANSEYHGEVVEGDICNIHGVDLRKISGLGNNEPLIIVGGPPCQPFSKAAYWTESGEDAAYRRARAQGVDVDRPAPPTQVKEDSRRDLVLEYWRIIEETNADGFVFENVPSIKHPRNRPVYEGLVQRAKEAGYEVTELTAKALAYGVAQARERVVLLGSKKRKPTTPVETHSTNDKGDLLLPRAVTAGEALEGFNSLEFFEPEEIISGRWAKHLIEVPPGWNYKALTEWAGHPNPSFVAETRFWNFLLKLSPDRPSWTIAASPGPWTGPFHWENRRLRTPELAALQGFPRGYKIEGPRRERVRQMGNAVPVPVAQAMVKSILESLE
ncbi:MULTISPECIES: DNA cytosine methyltransferase [Chromobacterium]|uniref:DNA cytosine methyltransferase n=1 Tax=Chromobacterium TaxID=535 RepID=UPI001888CFA2|nr:MULTISPECIES: DNA cytosine methyltransferase [Chromobacterium]QOZ82010.1 DNA cytosine methyltransferase [Chromobacterium sp. Rain0013]WON82014.1 DNA cytosine methyltransferase [Chromobacterium haemolyticum]